jgi:hypothetical protein
MHNLRYMASYNDIHIFDGLTSRPKHVVYLNTKNICFMTHVSVYIHTTGTAHLKIGPYVFCGE